LTTFAPLRDVSVSRARHSRVASSITARTRNLRPFARVSDTKSNDHRTLGIATVFGLPLFCGQA